MPMPLGTGTLPSKPPRALCLCSSAPRQIWFKLVMWSTLIPLITHSVLWYLLLGNRPQLRP